MYKYILLNRILINLSNLALDVVSFSKELIIKQMTMKPSIQANDFPFLHCYMERIKILLTMEVRDTSFLR
jgi:hypothetical protein